MVNQLDIITFRWLNSWAGYSSFFDRSVIFFAEYLWYVMVGVVIILVLSTYFLKFRQYRKRHFELLFFTAISAILARFAIAEFIQYFYHHPRPFVVLEGVRQLFEHSASSSFPSGHASLAFAIAASFYFYYPKTSIIFFLAALGVGLSRVAAGIHWPSDILGGIVVGMVSTWLVYWAWSALNKGKNKNNSTA